METFGGRRAKDSQSHIREKAMPYGQWRGTWDDPASICRYWSILHRRRQLWNGILL